MEKFGRKSEEYVAHINLNFLNKYQLKKIYLNTVIDEKVMIPTVRYLSETYQWP